MIGYNIRLFLFLLFAFRGLSFAQNKSEHSLLSELKQSKNEIRKVDCLNQLNQFYQNHNLIEQEKIVNLLKTERRKKNAGKSKNIIQLNLIENHLNQSNLKKFKSEYAAHLLNVKFREQLLNHRNEVLKIKYFDLIGKSDLLRLAENFVLNAKKSRKNQLVSESYQLLGKVFAQLNLSDSALNCGQLSSEYAARSTSKITLALSLRNQAQLYRYFGEIQKAVMKELEYIQISNELNNDLQKSLGYQDIAFILLESNNIEGAKLYLKRSQQLGENLLNKHEILKLQLAQILCDIKKKETNHIEVRLSLLKSDVFTLQNNELKGLYYLVQAKLLETKNKWKEAKLFYNKALLQYSELNNFQKQSQIHQQIAVCQINLNQFSEAKQSVFESMNRSKFLSNYANNENNKILSEIYAAQNKLDKAFQFQRLYLSNQQNSCLSKDAVTINDLAESNLREEREQFILSQKESIQKEREAKEKLENQRTRNLLISIIVAVILVLGLVILMLRNKQIKSQQQQKEAEMSQALLRTQMNPHFVFNAMSVIQSYIFTHNPEKSSMFLVNFSKLMRLILENSPKEFISLELEKEILKKYLSIQKLRFEDRFEFELDFDEDLISQMALVPPMITQPFVENAIEHGQLHTIENGKIIVTAKKYHEMLEIIVMDNGIGRKGASRTKKIKTHKSMAIDMTRERIEIINRKYRSNGNLMIEDFDQKTKLGTKVRILLPLKFE